MPGAPEKVVHGEGKHCMGCYVHLARHVCVIQQRQSTSAAVVPVGGIGYFLVNDADFPSWKYNRGTLRTSFHTQSTQRKNIILRVVVYVELMCMAKKLNSGGTTNSWETRGLAHPKHEHC